MRCAPCGDGVARALLIGREAKPRDGDPIDLTHGIVAPRDRRELVDAVLEPRDARHLATGTATYAASPSMLNGRPAKISRSMAFDSGTARAMASVYFGWRAAVSF